MAYKISLKSIAILNFRRKQLYKLKLFYVRVEIGLKASMDYVK